MAIMRTRESETAILARVFGDRLGQLHPDMARYIIDLDFNDRDKARMHELIVRNQGDELAPDEKQELFAFLNANSMLAILQARARRTIKVEADKQAVS